MAGIRNVNANLLVRLLVGLLGAYLIYLTVGGLISVLLAVRNGQPLEVPLVYASESAATAIAAVLCNLFMRRGELPSGRRQVAAGCLSAFGMSILFSIMGGLLVATLALEKGLEAAIRLASVFSGGAFGGALGLVLARPSSNFVWNKTEEIKGVLGKAISADSSIQSGHAWVGIVTAFVASVIGFWLTYLSFLLVPCLPSDAASDSGAVLGFAIVSCFIWMVASPLAMILGAVSAHGTIRWLKLGESRIHSVLAAMASGGFSGLVLIIISVTLFQSLFSCV